jgi:UPF0755 protein
VYDAIANGRVYVKEFVVPEGFTMFDIAALAESEGFLSREEFLAAARDPSPIRDIAPDAPSLEGFLFPATYEFPRHMTGKDLTAAMVKRFRQVWHHLAGFGSYTAPKRAGRGDAGFSGGARNAAPGRASARRRSV